SRANPLATRIAIPKQVNSRYFSGYRKKRNGGTWSSQFPSPKWGPSAKISPKQSRLAASAVLRSAPIPRKPATAAAAPRYPLIANGRAPGPCTAKVGQKNGGSTYFPKGKAKNSSGSRAG